MRRHILIVAFVFVFLGLAHSAVVRVVVAQTTNYVGMCADLVLKNGQNLGRRQIVGDKKVGGVRGSTLYYLIRHMGSSEEPVATPKNQDGTAPYLKNVGPCAPASNAFKGAAVGAQAAVQPTAVPVAPQAAVAEVKPTEPAPLTVLALEKEASENTGLKTGTIVLVLLVLAGVALIGGIIRWQGRKPKVEA